MYGWLVAISASCVSSSFHCSQAIAYHYFPLCTVHCMIWHLAQPRNALFLMHHADDTSRVEQSSDCFATHPSCRAYASLPRPYRLITPWGCGQTRAAAYQPRVGRCLEVS